MEAITNNLGLNWQGLLWHLANFAVLLFLLRLVLFKPIVTMLDARAKRVSDSMEQADAAKRAAEQAEADRQALLKECQHWYLGPKGIAQVALRRSSQPLDVTHWPGLVEAQRALHILAYLWRYRGVEGELRHWVAGR